MVLHNILHKFRKKITIFINWLIEIHSKGKYIILIVFVKEYGSVSTLPLIFSSVAVFLYTRKQQPI